MLATRKTGNRNALKVTSLDGGGSSAPARTSANRAKDVYKDEPEPALPTPPTAQATVHRSNAGIDLSSGGGGGSYGSGAPSRPSTNYGGDSYGADDANGANAPPRPVKASFILALFALKSLRLALGLLWPAIWACVPMFACFCGRFPCRWCSMQQQRPNTFHHSVCLPSSPAVVCFLAAGAACSTR